MLLCVISDTKSSAFLMPLLSMRCVTFVNIFLSLNIVSQVDDDPIKSLALLNQVPMRPPQLMVEHHSPPSGLSQREHLTRTALLYSFDYHPTYVTRMRVQVVGADVYLVVRYLTIEDTSIYI